MSPFEWNAIKIAHVRWIEVVWGVLTYSLIAFFYGSNVLIEIGLLDTIGRMIQAVPRYLNEFSLYNKENPDLGLRLYNRVLLFLLLPALVFVPLRLELKFLLVSLVAYSNYNYTDRWGYIYNVKRQVIADVLGTFYFIGELLLVLFWNPFGDIITSYYGVFMMADILWIPIKSVLVKETILSTYIRPIHIKEEWNALKTTMRRMSGDFSFEIIVVFGKLIAVSSIAPSPILALYLIVSQLPTFSIVGALIEGVKRARLQAVPLSTLRLYLISTGILILEVGLILPVLYMTLSEPVEPLSLLIFLIGYFGTLCLEYLIGLQKLHLIFRDRARIVLITRVAMALFVLWFRWVLQDATYIYYAQVMCYVVLGFVYQNALKEA